MVAYDYIINFARTYPCVGIPKYGAEKLVSWIVFYKIFTYVEKGGWIIGGKSCPPKALLLG